MRLDRAATLPVQPGVLIGRETELADIAALLADPACRLLTLLGPGGMGKTRLAIEAVRQSTLPHEVYFVPLQPLRAPDFMVAAIGSALGIPLLQSVDPKQSLIDNLQPRSTLLLLDNVEHLLEGVTLFSDLLAAAPGLKLLVTSRERLNLSEEWSFVLNGLAFPPPEDTIPLEHYAAVQLFLQRARQVRVDFTLKGHAASIISICQQLEGLPLGLELAAGWLRALSPEQIASRIRTGSNFLATALRNLPERHRSLAAVFEQSWNMLSAVEQAVLMRLSVFHGGFDLEAAEAVASASLPTLATLVDKSFIRLNLNGRYDLHELLRQFAEEKLALAGQQASTIDAYCAYYLRLAEAVAAHDFGREQIAWYDRAEKEWDNFRVALDYSAQAVRSLQMAVALGWFLSERAYWNEGLDLIAHLLGQLTNVPPLLQAKALNTVGALTGHLGNLQDASAYLTQACSLAESCHDRLTVAWSLSHMSIYCDHDIAERVTLANQSLMLFRELQDRMGLSHSLGRYSFFTLALRDYVASQQLLNEAKLYATEAGDTILLGWVHQGLGDVSWEGDHNLHQARVHFEKSAGYFQQARFSNGLYRVKIRLAGIERDLGHIEQSLTLYDEVIALLRECSLNKSLFFVLQQIVRAANRASAFGDYEKAAMMVGAINSLDTDTTLNLRHFIQVAPLQKQLGQAAFEQAWAKGHAMTREQVEAYLQADAAPASLPARHAPASDTALSEREQDILRLLDDGLNSREIAERLVLGVSTVRWYLKQIYGKLDVHSRAEALARARQHQLLP